MGEKKQRFPNSILRRDRANSLRVSGEDSVTALTTPTIAALLDESCQEKANEKQLKALIMLANQVFDLERKVSKLEPPDPYGRIVTKMKDSLAVAGIEYSNPIGEPFDETRADCEGHIAGVSVEDLVIVEVVKPIVRFRDGNHVRQLQRAVVIAHSRQRGE
jgi:hypothetical protein